MKHFHVLLARKYSLQSPIWIRISKKFTRTITRNIFAKLVTIVSQVRQIWSSTSKRSMKLRWEIKSFSYDCYLTKGFFQKEYECQTCKKPFKAKNRLIRHEKEVHMVRPFFKPIYYTFVERETISGQERQHRWSSNVQLRSLPKEVQEVLASGSS